MVIKVNGVEKGWGFSKYQIKWEEENLYCPENIS